MRKLFLLAFSFIASVASTFAGAQSDGNYWIIKDGRLCSDVEIIPYSGRKQAFANFLKDTVVNGENVMYYQQRSNNYLDVKLKLDSLNPVDLSKNYVMVLEYLIPAETVTLIDSNKTSLDKKPLFIIGMENTYAAIEDSPNPTTRSISTFIDGKYGPYDTWVTTKKYVYDNPSVKTIAGIVLSYAREVKKDIEVYPLIKNFYFEKFENNDKPFYAENFDGVGLGNFYNESLRFNVKQLELATFNGDIRPTLTQTDIDKAKANESFPLVIFRDFLPDSLNGQDGSGYYDCEILHALQVEPQRDSIVFAGIAIPEGCTKIYTQMLMKMHKNEGRWVIDPADSLAALDQDMPVRMKFDNGEVVDVTEDPLKRQWTLYKGEVPVPDGAKTVDLIFGSIKVGYLVDEVLLTTKPLNKTKDINNLDQFNVEAYIDADGSIVVLNGDLIAAYNLNGKLATINDKAIIIIVKNNEGAIGTKKLIRK